jgi:hypothetical protein
MANIGRLLRVDKCVFIEPDDLPDECSVRLAELALKGELHG